MKKTTQIYLLLLVAVISAAVFFFMAGKPSIEELKKSVAPAASLYPEAKSVSEKLGFINDDSQDIHLSELTEGKWSLLYFGYTSCPDVCPMDLSKISQSYQLMQHSDKLQVVFVSVDPMRDIGNLDNFASTFNSSFLGLTARQDEMMSISKTLGVYHEVVQSQKLAQEDHSNHGEHSHEVGGDKEHGSTEMAHYDLDHTSSYLLFNPNLELTALLTSPHKVVPMAEALDKIIETLGKD
tara:strand:- start:48 stop:761 length:714 start_codon:yes stop_codon:yes gene_type:complete